MLNNARRITAGVSRKASMLVVGIASTLVVLGGAASPAMAELKLEGEWAVFKQCPLSTPKLKACLHAVTSSGEFTIGSKTVPITNPITLQGGFTENEAGELNFVAAANGETLSKSPQTVPGGLVGIELDGITEVTATTELAEPASDIGLNETNLQEGKGVAISLPVKIKLSNPALGESCYIGSNAHPIVLELTTGTTSPPKPNKPITGKPGEFTVNPTGEILDVYKNTLVNNSFAAPGVNGCGVLPLLIDPVVDLDSGLPAAAGHNTAILDGELEQTSARAVKRHEPEEVRKEKEQKEKEEREEEEEEKG